MNTNHFLTVTDHSVTKETFELLHDADLDMLVTIPKPADLARYYESDDYISHTDQKRSMFEKLYHFVRGIALRKKVSIINSGRSAKGLLLDIGAGTGDFLNAALRDGWQTIGIEPNESARKIAESKGVHFAENSRSFADNSIDVITMWHVLEHVPDVAAQILELKRLLKSDGKIIVAVPNFKSFDAIHYGAYWAAYDVPRHLSHFSKTSIAKLFAQHNMTVIQHLPMKFDSFYVSMLSEKYKHGRIRYISAILNGVRSNWKASKSGEYSSIIYIIGHKNTTNRYQ